MTELVIMCHVSAPGAEDGRFGHQARIVMEETRRDTVCTEEVNWYSRNCNGDIVRT